MKKIVYYFALMMLAVLILPLVIVKGCSHKIIEEPDKTAAGLKIKVFISSEKQTRDMLLEEYVKGVVAAEMPAEFEPEALKAQAVAARTYAFSRMGKIYSTEDDSHTGADICTDPAHCQAWISKQAAMKRWGVFSAIKYWSKIDRAVNETQNVIIVYKDKIANPVFHSNSGGMTENSEEVWDGVAVPYLKSVKSDGEDVTSEYKNTVTIEIKEFIDKLKNEYKNFKINNKDIFKEIKITENTTGGRVKTIKVGNITVKGTDLRRIFSLKSANFKIEKGDSNTVKITTLGNGHGVGMSQWGANYLAKMGGSCEEILKYYYSGVELSTVDKF